METRLCLITTILLGTLFIGCRISMKSQRAPFHVDEATYHTWFAGENERGTRIIIQLSGIRKNVTFDTLIFRGLKLPVFLEEEREGFRLVSGYPAPGSVLEMAPVGSGQPDQLKYTYRNRKYSYSLDSLRNEGMRYIKPK